MRKINLDTKKEGIEMVGILYFYFRGNLDLEQECHIFKMNDFSGIPEETEEMKLECFLL